MISTLVAIGTLGWIIGYMGAVWAGIRDRSYAVPLVAVAFNFSYEIVLAWFFLSEKISFFRMMFAAWAVVDLGVLLTVLFWAHRDETLKMSRRQVYWLVLPLLIAFGIILWWYASRYGPENAAFYPAYAENVVMSALFIGLTLRRKGSYGQSFVLAWGKFIGTAGMTVLYGIVMEKAYAVMCGSLCFVLDATYLYLMHRARHRQKASNAVGRYR